MVVAVGLSTWVASGVWPGASAQSVPRQASARGELLPNERATIELFETARSSVVYITTQARVADIWTRNAFNVPRGTGSGFIWDDRGHIVTNNHVVAGASAASVRLSDGRDVGASLIGISPAHDLAVIRSVSDVDSNRTVGSGTHHSYPKRGSVAETAVPGLRVGQPGCRDQRDEYSAEDDQGEHRRSFRRC